MRSRVYVLINVLLRLYDRFINHLQIAHLRSNGAAIGKNLVLGKNCRISVNKGGKLTIGDNVVIDRFTDVQVMSNAKIEIGSRVYIGKRNTIAARQEVTIGDCCFTAHDVTILDANHNYSDKTRPIRDQGGTAAPVRLEGDAWIATGVTILPGVVIGRRAVVAAHSVVNKSVPSNTVVAGVPAKVIKQI